MVVKRGKIPKGCTSFSHDDVEEDKNVLRRDAVVSHYMSGETPLQNDSMYKISMESCQKRLGQYPLLYATLLR